MRPPTPPPGACSFTARPGLQLPGAGTQSHARLCPLAGVAPARHAGRAVSHAASHDRFPARGPAASRRTPSCPTFAPHPSDGEPGAGLTILCPRGLQWDGPVHDTSPQKMPLWHGDYFEFGELEKQPVEGGASPWGGDPSCSRKAGGALWSDTGLTARKGV